MPFFGPCLGTILRIVNRNKFTQIICIADNVIPHEKRLGDKVLTKYFLSSIHRFVTMSEKVNTDLKTFTQKPSINIVHPIYDNFGDMVSKEEARKYLGLPVNEKIILFFGLLFVCTLSSWAQTSNLVVFSASRLPSPLERGRG